MGGLADINFARPTCPTEFSFPRVPEAMRSSCAFIGGPDYRSFFKLCRAYLTRLCTTSCNFTWPPGVTLTD
jgi:hypothetical protein